MSAAHSELMKAAAELARLTPLDELDEMLSDEGRRLSRRKLYYVQSRIQDKLLDLAIRIRNASDQLRGQS